MLEKNLEKLKKFPEVTEKLLSTEIKLQYELSGKSIKVNGKFLFSKYAPEKEAKLLYKKIKEKVSLSHALTGIGNPFLLKEIINDFSDITVFIVDYQLFKIMLSYFDYSYILDKISLKDFNQAENIDNMVFLTKFEESLKSLLIKNRTNVRILLVKPFYGGSLPVANYCEQNFKKLNVTIKTIDSQNAYNALKLIDSTLQKKDNISRMRVFLSNFISELCINAIEEFKPDIIFALAQAPLNEKVLKYAKTKGIVTAFWFVEDYRLFKYWKYFAPLYDYYFTIQKDSFFNELKKIGVKNFHYLPLACEPAIHKPLQLSDKERTKYGSIISFVGAGYYNRRKFFRKLLEYDFKIWGSDWDNEPILKPIIQDNGRRVSTGESVKIFNASLINLNLHSSTYYEGIVPNGDFVNPRTFEIAACNAYQLVDRRKYLPLHFTEGKDILTFSTEEELKQLIKEITENPLKYENIKEASYKRVIEEHTYMHRIKEISKILGFSVSEKSPIISEEDFYLTQFNTLDEISAYIQKKDKITTTDTYFLLMKALKDTYLK